jgi:hypothetical protein
MINLIFSVLLTVVSLVALYFSAIDIGEHRGQAKMASEKNIAMVRTYDNMEDFNADETLKGGDKIYLKRGVTFQLYKLKGK